jgi:molybdopterin molybdotransferase
VTGFDTILMVDWSGGNDAGPTPRADAIWVCVARDGVADKPVYLRNRVLAESWISDVLDVETKAGRRVLAGFDFPFGYPAGFAKALTGTADPLAVWDWFEARIEDAASTNNRFDLAGQINAIFGGKGPFWFNGLKRDIENLPRRKTQYNNPCPEKRQCEIQAKGAFSCWQMGGTGAVGSQVFMGLPMLARLRRRFDAAIWPFDPLNKGVGFVEIWPSLTVDAPPQGMIKDAWQVREVARTVSALGAAELHDILTIDAPEEGWIFGLGHEHRLRSVASAPPPQKNDCFALPPGVSWAPVPDALQLLRARLSPVKTTERMYLRDAVGRVLAQDTMALRSNPPLPNTAVDGYGFAGGRGAGVHVLPLMQARAAAGDAPVTVPDGSAIRVLTGAALPQGVDTVVLQEDVTVRAGDITFHGPVKAGANTRKAGEDVIAGAPVLGSGRRIGGAEAALLAATGVNEVEVYAPLRVAVLSTGDELIEVGQTPRAGQIFDANRPMLLDMIARFGHVPVDIGRVADTQTALRAALDKAASSADVIVTSGGASAGDEDHVSALLNREGALNLWRIAVKPGRPLALGQWRERPVFGLPGNPVAAMVCTLIFARPAFAQMAGEIWPVPLGFDVPAAFSKRKKAGRTEYLRARMRDGKAEVFASEGSGRISGLVWAEGLVELPEQAVDIVPGSTVRYIPFGSFGL